MYLVITKEQFFRQKFESLLIYEPEEDRVVGAE